MPVGWNSKSLVLSPRILLNKIKFTLKRKTILIKRYHSQLDPDRRLAMRILDRVFSVIALSLEQGKMRHAININDRKINTRNIPNHVTKYVPP